MSAQTVDKNALPLVVIIGSDGNIGNSLKQALQDNYRIIGIDRPGTDCDISIDLRSSDSVMQGTDELREAHGKHIAAVVHLAAYFDFSGEDSPMYHEINEEGTRRLLKALQAFSVERFIYSSTMLVHRAGEVGSTIDESADIAPQWAYPQSKARTEKIIDEERGQIPVALLRLAGLYDDEMAVPTLANQIANIYEKDAKSMLYAGDIRAGQSFIHRKDMIDLFVRAIDRRQQLPEETEILAGEADILSYRELQKLIGEHVHGVEEWRTLSLPKNVAKAGAWLEESAEPLVPDDFDEGKKPFIKPFMIDLASDHYALDISRAKSLLGWEPQHSIKQTLPAIIRSLKQAPAEWYQRNGLDLPHWMRAASDKSQNPEKVRAVYEKSYRREHQRNLWAPMLNVSLGAWLISSPLSLGYQSQAMVYNDIVCGFVIIALAFASLSQAKPFRLARWGLGATGVWLMSAPLVFWAPEAATYTNSTLVGALVTGLALAVRPFPTMSSTAAVTGPDIPPGWQFSPSSWFQRLPIIILAVIGFIISHYMAAYQLGHIPGVWDPVFSYPAEGLKNGTEHIITSKVSEAWPVPDAGLGALVYLLEILTGIIGSRARWRTMPWLVLLFGFMIIPLGAVSITFIIIQPIVLGTWCSLCLIAAAAMLLQIPYSLDEVVATIQFLHRRAKAGHPWLRVLFTGDTDSGELKEKRGDNFLRPPAQVLRDIIGGGVSVPWTLGLSLLVGLWLMTTRLTLGNSGALANAEHLIGALVITITVSAFAEVIRPLRWLNALFGAALLVTPFLFNATLLSLAASWICGVALISLSVKRTSIENEYGDWNRMLVY